MRKLLRMKMRNQAEQQDGRTIKVFRAIWKKHMKDNGIIDPSKKRKKPTKKYLW